MSIKKNPSTSVGALAQLYNAVLEKSSQVDLRGLTSESVAALAVDGIRESLGGQVVYIAMDRCGIQKRRNKKLVDAYTLNGRSVSELAIEFGLSQAHVYEVLAKSSVGQERANKRKVRNERNLKIISARAEGRTLKQLAHDFGLSPTYVCVIIRKSKQNY